MREVTGSNPIGDIASDSNNVNTNLYLPICLIYGCLIKKKIITDSNLKLCTIFCPRGYIPDKIVFGVIFVLESQEVRGVCKTLSIKTMAVAKEDTSRFPYIYYIIL